jgi:K+-sensing histidine kinase KdpD
VQSRFPVLQGKSYQSSFRLRTPSTVKSKQVWMADSEPKILPRLFSKFTTKSDAGGTGLGLYISKGIVEAHHGKIWAENNSDGKGATFSFTIPLI